MDPAVSEILPTDSSDIHAGRHPTTILLHKYEGEWKDIFNR